MQKFRPYTVGKICLALLSMSLLTQTVFGYEDDKVSYLDSVSGSYVRNNTAKSPSPLLNMNSYEARGVETTMNLGASPVITRSNAKVNISLRESDVRQALRMLADKAKMNIILDSSVEGKITLDLNNITVNDAFFVIFKSLQLNYSVTGNTITVMSKEAAKDLAYERHSMTVLPVKYVNAENVAQFMNQNLFNSNIYGLSNRPIVTSNPRTNQIVIFGSPADVTAVKRVLPVIDTKPFINNYKVNHTTPKEMATLICDALFADSKGSGSGQTSDDSSSIEEENIILGGGSVACRDGEQSSGSSSIQENGLASFKATPLTITYFPDLGRISTYGGSVEQAQVIADFIKEHDKKQLMAYVELSVIELNETGAKSFDNAWNLWTPFISLTFSGSNGLGANAGLHGMHMPIGATTSTSTTEGVTSGPVYTSNSAFQYILSSLIQTGSGRVLTNPKIMVTNGRKAKIDMTSDYIKSVTSQILETSNGMTSGIQKTYEIGDDLGLMIEIVPFISPEGYVSMNITPEFATISDREYSLGEDGKTQELAATLLQRRDLQLRNIRIKDNETLILAGLIKETETQSATKLPFLSDLPFIGAFFRSNSSDKAKEELVILITPHIVNDSDDTNVYDL